MFWFYIVTIAMASLPALADSPFPDLGGGGGGGGVTLVQSQADLESCAETTVSKTCKMTADISVSRASGGTSTGGGAAGGQGCNTANNPYRCCTGSGLGDCATLQDSGATFTSADVGRILYIEEDGAGDAGAVAGMMCVIGELVSANEIQCTIDTSDACIAASNPFPCCSGANAGCDIDSDTSYQIDDPVTFKPTYSANANDRLIIDCNGYKFKPAESDDTAENVLTFLDGRSIQHDNEVWFKNCNYEGNDSGLDVGMYDASCNGSGCGGASRRYFEFTTAYKLGAFLDQGNGQKTTGRFIYQEPSNQTLGNTGSLYQIMGGGPIETGIPIQLMGRTSRIEVDNVYFTSVGSTGAGGTSRCFESHWEAATPGITFHMHGVTFLFCNQFYSYQQRLNMVWSGIWANPGLDSVIGALEVPSDPAGNATGYFHIPGGTLQLDISFTDTLGTTPTADPAFIYHAGTVADDDLIIAGQVMQSGGIAFASSDKLYVLDSNGDVDPDILSVALDFADSSGGVQDPPVNTANVQVSANTTGFISSGGKRYRLDASGVETIGGESRGAADTAPATCNPGDTYLDTNEVDDTGCTTAADNSLCCCTAADTWLECGN